MLNFFTFNGYKFFNKDEFKTLEIVTKEKNINNKTYLYLFVIDQSGDKIYESEDYKISEDGYKTNNGLSSFDYKLEEVRKIIQSI